MIPLDKCVKGKVYKLRARNIDIGVFNGETGFVGLREKFGILRLAVEYHFDQGPPFGTAHPEKELDIEIPSNVSLETDLGAIDEYTKRPVSFVRYAVWKFDDTNEEISSDKIRPIGVSNKALFEFLKTAQE